MSHSDVGPTGLALRTVYVTKPGLKVSASHHHLTFRMPKQGQVGKLPLLAVRQVVVMEGVAFTCGAIDACLCMEVPVTFLKRTGELSGHLVGPNRRDATIRLSQCRAAEDATVKLAMAKRLVEAKLANALTVLRKFMYNHPDSALKEVCTRIKGYLTRASKAETEDELRGYEGIAAREYFGVFGLLLRRDLGFNGRTRRPPRDPVNALLSLGYTILAQETAALLEASGLDSYVGFLHELKPGRPSLALDLMEPLRVAAIDRFVIRAVNLGTFTSSDFEPRQGTGGAVLLTADGRRKFFQAYEEWMMSLTDEITAELWAPRPHLESECAGLLRAVRNGDLDSWHPGTIK